MNQFKFKVGERVKIRKELIIGRRYYMDDYIEYDTFSERMRNNIGKEATIQKAETRGYKLDIDPYHYYTDAMLMKFVDVKAISDEISKRDKEDVESIVNHMLKLTPQQQIDHALDTKNEELLKKIIEKYPKQKR